MKNQINSQTGIVKKDHMITAQYKNILMLLLVLFFAGTCKLSFGQEQKHTGIKFINHFGISVKSTFTANGLGTFYIPSLFYVAGKNVFSVGTIYQKNKMTGSGLQLNYQYTLLDRNSRNAPYCDWLELYAFVNSNYHSGAPLGKLTQETERMTNPECNLDVEHIHVNVLETYAGIGLRIDLLKKLKWINCLGAGGYVMLNAPEGLNHSCHGASLMLRTGISYQF